MTTNAADALEDLETVLRGKSLEASEAASMCQDPIDSGYHDGRSDGFSYAYDQISALRASLADRQGEAVAWQVRVFHERSFPDWSKWQDVSRETYENTVAAGTYHQYEKFEVRALYAHPAPAAVTDEDISWLESLADALIECGGPTNNMRAVAVRRAIAALQIGGE